MILKPFVQDETIRLYTSSLSLLTCALVTLICVLFPAAVMMGLSSVALLCCHVFFSEHPPSAKEISHVGINSEIADI